ncbi:hypothetical protein, partial [Streptomyces thermovulgaris]|uniref:hypothetical protein n=1 Tax=Streptomyces thermovulgaris TaxID=1934 RepID=UPI001B803A96
DERDVLSTGALGGAHTVGVLTEQAKVNHVAKATGAAFRLTTQYSEPCITYRYGGISPCSDPW